MSYNDLKWLFHAKVGFPIAPAVLDSKIIASEVINIGPYYQRQKYRPMTSVSGNINYL